MPLQSLLDIILRTRTKGTAPRDVSKDLKNLDDTSKKVQDTWKKLSIAGVGVAAGLAAIGAAAERGMEIRRAEQGLIAYAGSAEEAARAIRLMQEATDGAISRFDATTAGAQFLATGLAQTADEAAHLADIAITLGASIGKGPQQSLEQLTLLLTNQSILRLDSFGVSSDKVRQRMAELTTETKEYTREQRFMIAFMEQAEGKMTLLDEAGFTAATSLDKLKTAVTDTKDSIAVFVADALEPVIDGFMEWEGATYDRLAAHARMQGATEEQIRQLERIQWLTDLAASETRGYAGDMRAMAGAAEETVGPLGDTALVFSEINRNIPTQIGAFIEDLEWVAAGGLEIQRQFGELQEQVEAGLDPEIAKQLASELFLQATAIQMDIDAITADQAAKNIQDTLGLSLNEAKLEVLKIQSTLLALDDQKITVDIEFRRGGYIEAQHGLDTMVGPGFGGPRMVLVGEGRQAERVQVTPVNQTTNLFSGASVNIASPLDDRGFRNMFEDMLRTYG